MNQSPLKFYRFEISVCGSVVETCETKVPVSCNEAQSQVDAIRGTYRGLCDDADLHVEAMVLHTAHEVFKQAIMQRKPVTCHYEGKRRVVCPHVIGTKHGKTHIIVWQTGGDSNSRSVNGGAWRCFDISKVLGAELTDGEWQHGDDATRPNTCVDVVELEVQL